MTQSQELAERIKAHLLNGGAVRLATQYRAMILQAKHAPLVSGSARPSDSGVYIQSGKSRAFWMAYTIAFSKPTLKA